MRIALLIAALTALAFAAPYPQEQELPDEDEDDPEIIPAPFPMPTVPIRLTTSLNIPITTLLPEPAKPTSSGKKPHWEPIPIFTKECKCDIATVRYPCWATDALQVSACGTAKNERRERYNGIWSSGTLTSPQR